MLKEFTSNNLVTNSIVELGEVIDDTQGKGRSFVSRFIEAGVAHYREFGDVLITKETLDKFIHTMVGCPVIINHKDITEKNADKERVGVVCEVWFEPLDGWYYCKGIIWDKQAIDLVKNQGWNVSCTYDFESDFIEKTHNGKKIDMEFTNGKFLHLALVNNPRYERANIVVNSREQVENEKTEFVTVGEGDSKHIIPLDYINKDKKEKDREEKQKQAKDFEEIYKKMITPEVIKELNESIKAQLAENPNAEVGDTIIESDRIIALYSQKLTPQEYSKFNWDKAEDVLFDKLNELEKARGFRKYKDEAELDKQTKKETKEAEKEKYKLKENSKVTQKRFDNLFDNGSYLENHQFRKTIVLDNKHQVEFDKKRGFITFYEQGDLSKSKDYNAPKGTIGMVQKFRTDDYNKLVDYLFKNNEEWRFDRNKAENRKDKITMSLFKDLEKFVENAIKKCEEKEKFEEEETIVENEDKRKVIDEVGGILKDKVDEEVWRTVIGKLEKIAYEPSEKTKADNKCKNEDEEDEEEYEEMKEIAEDVEDKKGKKEEKKEEKEEEKKEVKNSMDDVAKMVYGQAETVKSYTTTEERLELGNNY